MMTKIQTVLCTAFILTFGSIYAEAAPLVIQAKGTLLANVGPVMQLKVNGVAIASVQVKSTTYQNYSFDANINAGDKVDIVFTNDARNSTEDRNLYVQSISYNGSTLLPTDKSVTYDRGFGSAAFDGKDVIPGQVAMNWGGALRYVMPTSTSPAVPITPQPTACLTSPNAHNVSEYGSFTPDASDAITRLTNTATINKALDAVAPPAGTVCLPPGTFYLTNRAGQPSTGQQEAIAITHTGTTLWGAGQDSSAGGTRLVTRSDWNLLNGEVFRGQGLRIIGVWPEINVPTNITIRDFELDGGAGYTGQFDWPANTTTGDGWDISHKGIILAWDDCVGSVTMQRIWVHSYRGENIYNGGHCLKNATIDSIRSEDTNGSTFNITTNFTVSNSYFGKSLMWMELGAGGPYDSSTWTNNTFKDATRYGIAIAQGDGRVNTPHVFKNNTFTNCGKTAFYLGGGAGGPIQITNNTFTSCSGFTTDYAFNAASWSVSTNQLLTFSNNTLTNVGTLGILGSSLVDSVISNNQIINTTGVAGNTTATMLCGSNYTNVVISGNTFTNTRTPEQACPVTQGTRPLYKDNIYISPEMRYGQGNIHITSSNALITPLFEQVQVVTEIANVVAILSTDRYPDGQVVTLTGGTVSNPLLFPMNQETYQVPTDRILNGNSLKFVFNLNANKWIDAN